MTEPASPSPQSIKQTDAAALAAGAVAIVLTTYLDKGKYELLGAIVAFTLTFTLLAYLLGRHENGWQRTAFSAVVGLTATPLIGFLLEMWLSGNPSDFFGWTVQPRPIARVAEEDYTSGTGSLMILAAWFGVAAIVWVWDWLLSRRPNDNGKGQQEEVTGDVAKKVDTGSSPA